MSKQTQLPWASTSSSSSRPPRANGSSSSSRDDRDVDMKDHHPPHLKHRIIYKANRSHSLTPTLLPTPLPHPSHSTSPAPSTVSVLGKRSGGSGGWPFVFVDGEEPLDYTDFTQTKLPLHSLLYLCADQQYSNKHVTHHTDEEDGGGDEHDDRRDDGGSDRGSRMELVENGKAETLDHPTALPQPQPRPTPPSSVRYDAFAPTNDNEQQPSVLFVHHPFHRFYRSYKAALAAWKQRQTVDQDGSASGRVMEFACREALHILHVSAQQRSAVFAFASASSAASSPSSFLQSSAPSAPSSYLPSPPPLLSHLLSTHNGCVGYEVEGEETDGIVLTTSACECQLALLDDDKRAHVSQALLTDMFAKLHC